MSDESLIHVEKGVNWTPDSGGEERDLAVAVVAIKGHEDLNRVCLGPSSETYQEARDGGMPVLLPDQAMRVGLALVRAAERTGSKANPASDDAIVAWVLELCRQCRIPVQVATDGSWNVLNGNPRWVEVLRSMIIALQEIGSGNGLPAFVEEHAPASPDVGTGR